MLQQQDTSKHFDDARSHLNPESPYKDNLDYQTTASLYEKENQFACGSNPLLAVACGRTYEILLTGC